MLEDVQILSKTKASSSGHDREAIQRLLQLCSAYAVSEESGPKVTQTSNTQTTDPVRSQRREGSGLTDVANPSFSQVSSVSALHRNGPILFESKMLSAVSAIGIRTAQFPRTPCAPWCSCACHYEKRLQSPRMLQSLIGIMFIGYSGLPNVTPRCDQFNCHQRSQPAVSLTYFFPAWFMTRAISAVLVSTPLAGPVVSLKCHRAVSSKADIFNAAVIGDVETMKRLFEGGFASPHDMHYQSGVTALHASHAQRLRFA